MTALEWRPFLERFSREVLADREQRASLPPDVVASGWLGFAPATSGEIEALEQRLGQRLPNSYRDFLLVTNGWRTGGSFVYDLLPVAEVDWFRDRHQDWLDAWAEGARDVGGPLPVSDDEYFVYGPEQDSSKFREDYWAETLAISGIGDDAIYLLNPLVVTADGEWEAWCFANWLPGAQRHRTFAELLHGELESFVKLRERREETLRPKG